MVSHRRAVARHRPGRRRLRGGPHGHVGRGPAQQAGRRRPGDDVRLRLRRDRRPHAAADLPGPPPGRAPGRGAQGRHRARTCAPTARPRSPSSTRTASRSRLKTVLISTQHNDGIDRDDRHPARPHRARHPAGRPGPVRRRRLRRVRQPDRPLRHRGSRSATPASPAARSSSTPTAAWAATAAGRSRARTRPRSTAPRPTRRAGWPRTWSPRARRRRCEVQVAYAIGVAHPVSILVETFGTETVDHGQDRRRRRARSSTCVRPRSCATSTCAGRSTSKTAAYGHFGRAPADDGVHLGAHRPGRRPQVRPRALSGPRP